MPHRWLTTTIMALALCAIPRAACAEIWLGIKAGPGIPVSVSAQRLKTGFNAGLTFGVSANSVIVGGEVGLNGFGGGGAYVDPGPDYRLTAIPILFTVKYLLPASGSLRPYVVTGLGYWRVSEHVYAFDHLTGGGGWNAGLGLTVPAGRRMAVGIESRYEAIQFAMRSGDQPTCLLTVSASALWRIGDSP